MQPPVLMIDGLNLFFRHFAANPTMSNSGSHAGGIVGFLRTVQNLVSMTGPRELVVVWESGGSSRRRSIFPQYKSGRKPQKLNRFYEDDIPETLENVDDQIQLLISLMKNLPIKQFYVKDCEADDIIGFLVKNALREDPVVIVSSDRDFHQLINRNVVQWTLGRKKFINCKSVLEEYGVHPENFCTVRCFNGDGSDNISGISGAGFKVMSKRFPELANSQFVSVEDIIKKSKEMIENSKLKIYSNIIDEQDLVRRNWKLMYLDSSNLAAHQAKMAIDLWESEIPKLNKLNFSRTIIKFGLNKFDTESFFLDFKNNIRRTQ
jgi:5'-3' exonuclease